MEKNNQSSKRIIILVAFVLIVLLLVLVIKALNERHDKNAVAQSSSEEVIQSSEEAYLTEEAKSFSKAVEKKRDAENSKEDKPTINGYEFWDENILENAGFSKDLIEILKNNIKNKIGEKDIRITFTRAERAKSELGTYSNIIEFDSIDGDNLEVPYSYISGNDGADGGDVFVNNNKK